jgi:hypothetical protein
LAAFLKDAFAKEVSIGIKKKKKNKINKHKAKN